MVREIFEFEFKFTIDGKSYKVQQSAFSWEDAKNRIREKYLGAENFELIRKLHYPHMEGGKPIKL